NQSRRYSVLPEAGARPVDIKTAIGSECDRNSDDPCGRKLVADFGFAGRQTIRVSAREVLARRGLSRRFGGLGTASAFCERQQVRQTTHGCGPWRRNFHHLRFV